MKKEKNVLIPLLFTIILIAVTGYNVCASKWDFLETKFYNILTIGIAVWLSFYFTQNKLDRRKFKDAMGDILKKLDVAIHSDILLKFDDFTEEKYQEFTMFSRQIENYINIIDKYIDLFDGREDLNYIKGQWDEYSSFVDTNINNPDKKYLQKSQNTLRKYLINITTKVNQLYVMLFSQP